MLEHLQSLCRETQKGHTKNTKLVTVTRKRQLSTGPVYTWICLFSSPSDPRDELVKWWRQWTATLMNWARKLSWLQSCHLPRAKWALFHWSWFPIFSRTTLSSPQFWVVCVLGFPLLGPQRRGDPLVQVLNCLSAALVKRSDTLAHCTDAVSILCYSILPPAGP